MCVFVLIFGLIWIEICVVWFMLFVICDSWLSFGFDFMLKYRIFFLIVWVCLVFVLLILENMILFVGIFVVLVWCNLFLEIIFIFVFNCVSVVNMVWFELVFMV